MTKGEPRVAALERGVKILTCFLGAKSQLTLTEIAEMTGFYKSTALRLCGTLQDVGLLYRNRDGLYALGPLVGELGNRFDLGNFINRDVIHAEMRKLHGEFGETVAFYIPLGSEQTCLLRIESDKMVRASIQEGQRLPIGNEASGLTFFLKSKYVPLSVSYSNGKVDQKELISNRTFKNEHTSVQGRINKSFSSRDNHKLSYNYNDYHRQDNNLTQIQNKTQEVTLNDNVFIDRNKKYYFSSLITGFDQEGNNNYQRLQARENINLKLPERLNFNANYFYNNIKQDLNSSVQHQVRSRLSHELFLSLKTSVYFEYSNLDHTAYLEKTDRQGIDIKYTKKIPKGQLSLSYHYFRFNQQMDSDPVTLQVLMEPHALVDNEMVYLDKEYIDIESVVVKDATGTIIYQENLDYVLIERNTLVEIQRIPGGQITDGQTVYVDYVNTRNESFKYVTNNNTFSANLSFFSRLVEVYYRTSKQDYSNIEKSNFVTLNYYTQNVVGTRLTYKIFSGGVEYDYYNSDIIPYKLLRYYIRVQGKFHKRFLYTVNGNYRDYKMIDEDVNQKFADISARLAYSINSKSKINVEASYRNQTGREIDLDLFTLRTEYSAIVRQMYFKVGAEMYNRSYLNESVDFIGGYVKVARRF